MAPKSTLETVWKPYLLGFAVVTLLLFLGYTGHSLPHATSIWDFQQLVNDDERHCLQQFRRNESLLADVENLLHRRKLHAPVFGILETFHLQIPAVACIFVMGIASICKKKQLQHWLMFLLSLAPYYMCYKSFRSLCDDLPEFGAFRSCKSVCLSEDGHRHVQDLCSWNKLSMAFVLVGNFAVHAYLDVIISSKDDKAPGKQIAKKARLKPSLKSARD